MATKTPLQSVTLTSTTTGLTFSNIDQTYTDLEIIISGTTNPAQNISIRYNGDTGNNYSGTYMGGDGSSTLNGNYATQSSALSGAIYTGQTYISLNIGNYSSSVMYKALVGRTSAPGTAAVAYTSSWRNPAPITSITFTNALDAGVTISIYGIRSGGTAKAAGGDTITTDGSYWYHVFSKTGFFSPITPNLTGDVLVIAGGGGGGYNTGGGGGAGGLRLFASYPLISGQTYPVIVGAGGTTGSTVIASFKGSNSAFGTIAANGGGGGAGAYAGSGTATPGGSGGGGDYTGAGGAGNVGGFTPVEGYAGGTGAPTYNGSGSGGGGAGGAGNGGAASGGVGGIGAGGVSYANYAILDGMGAATSTGVLYSGHYYYAAGGGGGGYGGGGGATGNGAVGGTGGGGTGGNSYSTPGSNGTINTGSGGGGGAGGNPGQVEGGTGSSGLVIVRYPV
jgi:hypothetical protein